MMKDLTFDFEILSDTNFKQALDPSLREFYKSDEEKASIFFRRYKMASLHKEIIYCSLHGNGGLLSSCILVSAVLKLEDHDIKGFFLTQVVTEREHRQRGYLKILLSRVEELCIERDTSVIVVIARRSAGDVYWKLGFHGFSHFPIFVKKRKNQVGDKRGLRTAELDDLRSLQNAHSNSRYLSNLRIERTENDWQDLILLQSSSTHAIWVDDEDEPKNYAIYKNGTLIESSGHVDSLSNREFYFKLERSSQEILLDRYHPLAACLNQEDWNYTERYEPREGHLFKIVKENSGALSKVLHGELPQKNKLRLEISPIDQW
jgi:hypothetical protein